MHKSLGWTKRRLCAFPEISVQDMARCGAVSGMTMVAGLAKGYDEVNNAAAKAAAYDLERKIVEEFRARNGALTCRELLEIQEKYKESGLLPNKEPFNTQRPCIYLVKSATEILEKDVFDR